MVLLHQLMVRGVRSVGCSEEETQVIRFLDPLTIISGPNGSGKTSLIEALNFITTGALPSGKLASFVHSLEVSRKARVDGMIKLQFTDCKGRLCVATKRVNATMSKVGKLQCKSDEFNIQITTSDGQVRSLSSKVADFQKEIINLIGVPAAILDNVIFCHQEESDWPLSEPKELKLRFDRIFQLTRFVKALEIMKKMKKDCEGQLATILEKQSCKEMILKSKAKYLRQRESCENLRRDSKEKIRSLDLTLKSCAETIANSNEHISKLENLERKAEVKRAELRMLTEQLACITVTPYPGSEDDLRAEIREIDSSREFREIDSKRDHLKRKIESTSKEITLVKAEKEEIEHEMRKIMSMEMVRSDMQNEVRKIENELVSVYGFHGPSYVDEFRNRITSEEKDMENLRNDLTAARESEQNRMDAAHMEFTKLSCEADSVSSAIEQANRQIDAEEKKLQDAVSSQAELAELASKIANIESLLSKLPKADEKKTESLHSMRQSLQKEIELLRERSLNAEKFEETKGKIEKKQSQKDEIELRLKSLLEKHNETFLSAFGEITVGPWSTDVNGKVKSAEDSNVVIENDLKRCERDLDRANQAVKQLKVEEQKLLNEVDQLKEKISDLCGCSQHEVADNLSETRHLLSKARKELASLSTKALLYEAWSEETKKRSCCPLCERRFSSKGGATELSGKLLDMSLSMPNDIERLERQVQEAEEKERRLANAVVFAEQCKKIMEEKVRSVRKQISDYTKEEATLSEKVEQLREMHMKGVSAYKQLLEVKADVSLMDSLLSSVETLTSELDDLCEVLSHLPQSFSLLELNKDIADKEERLGSVNVELEEIQRTLTERNKLMAELHTFKERRMSLGEFAAQSAHIQQLVARHRADIAKLTDRHRQILDQDLPRARNALSQAKNSRDIAERFAKEQEEIKLCEIRGMRNRLNNYVSLLDKLAALPGGGQTVEDLTRRLAEREASIIDLERRKTGFEIGINDLEGCHSKRRILEDQLTRKLVESKILKIEQELSEMACNGIDKEMYRRQQAKATKEHDEASLEKARLIGQLEEVDKKISEAALALSSKEMKQAEALYHEVVVEKIVTQEMITDLEKYMQCLDTCIIQFHTEKMIAINAILDDLWRKVYDGTDIHSISIKSECAASSEKRKVYDYRVVMVVRNNVELDMRDRCSAGQKMLACILIRLALADVFGGMCSIIALDEPTTNLDALKVDHMAAMLNSLIAVRRRGYSSTYGSRKKQSQMIIITHDDHLVDKLMIGSKPDFIYVLRKDNHGISHIRRQYSDGHSEEANGVRLDM